MMDTQRPELVKHDYREHEPTGPRSGISCAECTTENAPACDCWVAGRPPDERFQIRYGAHCADCPAYRETGDPVDRESDKALHDIYHIDA